MTVRLYTSGHMLALICIVLTLFTSVVLYELLAGTYDVNMKQKGKRRDASKPRRKEEKIMDDYIGRASMMGQLTSTEMQRKMKQASGSEAYDEFLLLLNSAPAADVVPVVHCRHCRSYNKPRLGWCAVHMDCEGPDDFCGYGKRNEVT